MNNAGPLLTDLIVGFLAGACIRRMIWWVPVCYILPFVVAILAVHPRALVSDSAEEKGWAMIGLFLFASFGFIATGAGLALGALFRMLIKKIPKAQSGTYRPDAIDGPADRKD